ncbi:FHA domain-containing protein [Streptomyces sp. SID13588]|uniref:FHA domain-containing protein n=1 Tax=Streptomyces sp. SID13588 TaxID=2706051 RepID=UPI0013C69F99|nr:FHA domain-containing protein [Streptomyces sp. SID13588]NEA73806.1 FHA domain-containing protein [Streptomyces sp. SID13588]
MSPEVIIDVANMARVADGLWKFSRITEIRDQWMLEHPGAHRYAVYAVLDAGVLPLFVDQPLVHKARAECWLELHSGDADDVILRLAHRHDAAVVSRDRFNFARREYPWLQGSSTRVWDVRRSNGRISLILRHLKVATDAEIEEDRRKKSRKAGLLPEDPDRRWQCTAVGPNVCHRSGAELATHQVRGDLGRKGRYYCRACEHEAVEIIARAPLPEYGPLEATLLHGTLPRLVLEVPEGGLWLGRRSRSGSAPVTDVTTGLPEEQAREISRTHLHLFYDDDGELMVEHVPPNNHSFLNPQLDLHGAPSSNRLVTAAPYVLESGDELYLGPGTVRLRINRARLPGGD